MNKLEVQKFITKDGQPLDLDKFEWCEETNTFTSNVEGLVINLSEFDDENNYINFEGLLNVSFYVNPRLYAKLKNNAKKILANNINVTFKE